ncbi:hypothetical protein VMCG_01429 [Cytospora schulzeri]|uniref:Uncharacterized protein n=1 Tax=Cytospora schulzeri TaxID=448051 RepID=A0A423X5N2_9PEZI|nr:hypothetical protein VMCG_01429 [Valsa malicola]
MPPRPPSRCCRAGLQHRANASAEAIWVTDDALRRSVQRYLNKTGIKSRTVSSVPGTMYHRQRFGRRRMTELNSFQSVGALPVWALPNAPDMTKWTWEPPKPPSCWPQLSQQEIEPEPSLLPEFAPKPCEPPQPPVTSALGHLETVQERSTPRLLDDPHSPLGLDLQHLYNTDWRSGKGFNNRFQRFARLLQKEISQGQLRGSEILVVYSLARRVFVRAGHALPELKGASLLPLLSAVINGISAAKRLNPTFVTSKPRLWIILLKHLARQEIGETSAKLFSLVMESMPARCRFRTRGAVLNVLHAYFKLWQGSTVHGQPNEWSWSEASQMLELASTWVGRVDELTGMIKSDLALGQIKDARSHMDAARRLCGKAQRFTLKTAYLMSDDRVLTKNVAEALKNHDPRIHRSLFVIATRLLGKSGGVKWSRAHYNWLQILARLPRVSHSQFKKLLQFFPKRGRAALSHVELCDLLLLHWDSQGLLVNKAKTRLHWNRVRAGNDSTALAALALAINSSHHPEECAVLFWNFWNFVRLRPGSKAIIKQVLSLSELHGISSGFLQRLAWASNDTRVALLLHDVLAKQTGNDYNFWRPAFWDKFSTQFSHKWKYPLLNPLAIAKLSLGPRELIYHDVDTGLHEICDKQPKQVTDRPLGKQLAKTKMANRDAQQLSRIKSSLNLFIGAPHLTERQKIHYVTSFTKHLFRVQGFLTARDLSSLTTVVTRVLERGGGGSTERLRWYLGIIYEQLGEETCAQVGMVLRRRREANWRRWCDELRNKSEEMGQRHVSTLLRKDYSGPRQGRVWPLWRYYVPKNRLRAKRLGRLKAKARWEEHEATALAEQPHEKPVGSNQNEAAISPATEHGRTYDGDVLGTLLKESHQPRIGRSVSF